MTPPPHRAPLPRPQAVIFDMDGLLVDSERVVRVAWQAAATDCGFDLHDQLFLSLVGRSTDESERIILTHAGPELDLPRFRERCHVRLREVVERGGIPFKVGARELLDWLTSLRLPLGVATSSSREEARGRLASVEHLLHSISTRSDVARGKPSPDVYLAAAASLGADPARCLALEDSLPGVRAAHAAGMTVLMVPDLVSPTPEVAALASGVFPSLVEVLAVLQRAWEPPAPGVER